MSTPLPIVVCGESLLDVFAAGDTPTGMNLNAVVGGSPMNVALGLARLAQPAWFFGAVSRDFLGQRIERSIVEEGIRTDALVHCDAPTTLSLVGVDAQGVPSYRFYGHGGADRQLLPEHLALLPADVAAFHFGSFCTVVEPVGSTLRQVVEQRRGRSVISYDPNVRLNVEPALHVWRDLIDWMASRAHFIKLSDEDFDRLYPGDSHDALAARLLSAGAKLVMMTRGGEGAYVWSAAGHVSVGAPQVQVLDTVGAGDTFQAAVLAALAELGKLDPQAIGTLTIDEMTRVATFAAGAAAITCTRRGPDLPRRGELPAAV